MPTCMSPSPTYPVNQLSVKSLPIVDSRCIASIADPQHRLRSISRNGRGVNEYLPHTSLLPFSSAWFLCFPTWSCVHFSSRPFLFHFTHRRCCSHGQTCW